MNLPNFITHYFESDKGPFRNICEHVTFMYPDHFNLVWSKGLFTPISRIHISLFMIYFSPIPNCRWQ